MFKPILSYQLEEQIKKLVKKDKSLVLIINKKIKQICLCDLETIDHYKNLRHDLSECKRVHIDKYFVMLFEVNKKSKEIIFYKINHHDLAYKWIKMSEKITIICDLRERASQVMSELQKLGTDKVDVEILQEQLSVGDYQITDDIVIERKTLADLNASIIDGRIFDQISDLLKIKKSALIIEGTIDYLDNSKGINKKAIVGLLTKIGLEYRIPIFFTKNQKETALFLYVVAKREQLGNNNKENRLRFSKTKMSFSERQLFIMESFPDIGPTLAKSLLLEFKSIKNIANADQKDLQKVSKMGPKKAQKIKYLLERSFCD